MDFVSRFPGRAREMVDGTTFPCPSFLQQALIFTLLMGIATFLLFVVLRLWCRPGVRKLSQQPCNPEAQQPTEAETHSEAQIYAGNLNRPCSPRRSASELRNPAHNCSKGLLHQPQLHLDQHYLQFQCLPYPNLCVYSEQHCRECSSPRLGESVLTAGPDADASATMHSASAPPTPEGKSTDPGSQILVTSPAIVPATPQGTFTSKRTGACSIADLAANVAPGASDVVGEALPSDTACRPDNMSSAYNIARALVCHPWAQSYTPMFTLGRVALKIPDRHPSDLGPLSVWTRPYCEALEKEGISLVGTYVRQGCIHIVLDLLDLAVNSIGTSRGTGTAISTSAGQHRHGRHLLESERAERCSSGGTSRSSSRRRSGRATTSVHAASEADGGGGNAVSASSMFVGRVSAPGDLLPLAVPGHDLSTPPQQRLQLSRRNMPVRVRSAEATGSAAAGLGRISLLARVASVTTGNASRSNGDSAPHGENDDDNDDDDDGSGSLTAHGRLHLLSARRLRQLRRASASSLVSGAAGIPRSAVPPPQPPPSHLQSVSARDAVASVVLPPAPAVAASRLQEILRPEVLVQMLGQEIAGGGQTVTVQLPWGSGVWNVQMRQVGAAPTAVPAPPVPRPPPDLSCIWPPCVLAGAPGPVMMYAAVTDVQGVEADASEGTVAPGLAATAGSDGAVTVHMRFGGAYQPCRSSLLGDQMYAEAFNQIFPSDALRRTDVLCVQLAVPPPLPGLMFVECQRAGLLGLALPVLVAPNMGVWQEVAGLQDVAIHEGGTAMTAVHRLVLDLGLWFNYLSDSPTPATVQPVPSQRSGQEPLQGRLQDSRARLLPQVQPVPAQTSLGADVVPAVPQLEVSSAGESNDDFVENNFAVSGWTGGQQPPASSAAGGTGNGLGRLFGRSLMRLLSDAEIIERQMQPQVETSPQSQPSPMPGEEQQRGDGIRCFETMLACAEHHQRHQQLLQQQQSQRHRHHGLEEHPERRSHRDAGIAEFTGSSHDAIMDTGVSVYEGEKHSEVGLQLLGPHVGVANQSSPGPSNEADMDAAMMVDYMRAISDPQTHRAVASGLATALAGGEDGGMEGVGLLTYASPPLASAMPQGRTGAAAGSNQARALSLRLEDHSANKGEDGDNNGGSPSSAPSVGQGQGIDVTGPFGSKGGAAAAAAAVVAGIASVVTAPATCSACVSACCLSHTAAPQPPHAQSLYNGRWQLPPRPPSPPQVRPDKPAAQAQVDKNASEGGNRILSDPALPLQSIASQPAQALGNGGAEAGDAGNLSPAVSADMLALDPLEVAALSHTLMAGDSAIPRTGASGSTHNLPPVRTESSGTELHSWDSLTEMAQVVSTSLSPPSGALAATPRSCSTLAATASPSPSPRPSLQLCNDGSRLRHLGSSNVPCVAAPPPSTTVATSMSLVDSGGGAGRSSAAAATLTRSTEEVDSWMPLQRNKNFLQLSAVSVQTADASEGQHRRGAVGMRGTEARQAHDCVEASATIAEPPAALTAGTLSITSKESRAARGLWPVATVVESLPVVTEAGAAGTLEEESNCVETGMAAGGLAGRSGLMTSTASAGIEGDNTFADAAGSVIPSISARAGDDAGAANLAFEAAPAAGPQSAAVATNRVSSTFVEPLDIGAMERSPAQGHLPAFATAGSNGAPYSAALSHARIQHLGLGLLAFSVRRGWVHTTFELIKGLARVGVDLVAADAAVSAREGGLGLLHLAVIARQPALLRTMLTVAKVPTAVPGSSAATSVGNDVGELTAFSACKEDFTWDVGARGPLGLTPLHLAVALEDGGEVAAELLEVFPDAPALWFTAADDSGCTPADMAAHVRLDGLSQWAGRRLAESAARQQQQQQQQPGDGSQLVHLLQRQVAVSGIHLQQPGQTQPQTASSLAFSSSETTAFFGVGTEAEDGGFHGVPMSSEEAATVPTATAAAAAATVASIAHIGSSADTVKWKWNQSSRKDACSMRWLESLTRSWPKQMQIRGSCLRSSLVGFADPFVEARYREFRVHSLGAVDRTCGIVFTSLFALPALDLAMQHRGRELTSHCIFNAGLLGPYLLYALAPAQFRKHRDAALMIGDVVKALLVLLVLFGAVPLPQIWAEFARGYMDVVMLVVIKPLSEQIQVRVAVIQRIAAVVSDTYMYATVLYGGAIVPALVRAVLQNATALALLLLLDMRARLRFLTATSTLQYIAAGGKEAIGSDQCDRPAIGADPHPQSVCQGSGRTDRSL